MKGQARSISLERGRRSVGSIVRWKGTPIFAERKFVLKEQKEPAKRHQQNGRLGADQCDWKGRPVWAKQEESSVVQHGYHEQGELADS